MTLLRSAADWFALRGTGYQFWSGIGSGSPILAAVFILGRHHICRERGCYRFVFAAHPDHGAPVCRRHHPAG